MKSPVLRASLACLCVALSSAMPAAAGSAVATVATVPVGRNPGPVAVTPPDHRAFVVNRNDDTVSVIDTEKLDVIKVIPVGAAPASIAAEPISGMVYVANSGAGTVSAISESLAPATWTVGGSPIAIVVDSVLGKIYVADSKLNRVDILNASTGAVLATINTTFAPVAIALNIATHTVFVACNGVTGSVVVINGQTNQMQTNIAALPAGLQSIAVDYTTNVAVVVSPSANAHIVIDAGHAYAVTTYNPLLGCGPGVIKCVPNPVSPALVMDIPGFYFAEANVLGVSIVANQSGGYPFGGYWGVHQGVNGGTTTGLPVLASALAFNPGTFQMGTDTDLLDLYYDPTATGAYHPLTLGGVSGMAFDPLTARLFIASGGDNAVRVYNSRPEIAVPATDIGIGRFTINDTYADTNPATGTAYTLRNDYLYAIDEAAAGAGAGGLIYTAGVTAIAMPSAYSSAVAVNPATNRIYAANSGLLGIDGATNAIAPVSTMPAGAISILECAVDSGQNRVLALNSETYTLVPNALYILDGATDAVLKVVTLDNRALYTEHDPLLVDPARSLAYVVGKSVYVIDTAGGAIVATIPLAGTPYSGALDPAASRLYVTTDLGIVVIDTQHNSIVRTVTVPSGYNLVSVAANPLTGRYYVGADTAAGGFVAHVLIYNAANDKLIVDLSGKTYPAIVGDASIVVDPLTDTIYVGAVQGSSTSALAAIDGRTNAVSAVAPSAQESTSYALAFDLGSGILAAAGYDYTNLFFPTSDIGGIYKIPIAVTAAAAPDAATIATAPILRTHNTRPVFNLSATNGLALPAAAPTPKRAFYQIDGWQGKWTGVTLKAQPGGLTATGQAKVTTALPPGRHILYSFSAFGDAATIQSDFTGGNSSITGPISATVFTVER